MSPRKGKKRELNYRFIQHYVPTYRETLPIPEATNRHPKLTGNYANTTC